MSSFALAFLFIIELCLGIALLWLWLTLRDQVRNLETRVSESLDDQDLMDFQERVSGLLAEVREAGQSMTSQIEQRRASLERELSRARETEKRLGIKLLSVDKAQEKAKTKIEEWVQSLEKKAAKSKAPKKNPKASAPDPEAPKAPDLSPPLKVSYLSREFRAPEAQAPVRPTANRYLRVYEMSDQGFSHEEIAKACGYLPGEVELILNLRPRPRA